ncbi:hypothetical protein EXIGLDRAFT_728384, partial [Exidia glandulosa HHB12029]
APRTVWWSSASSPEVPAHDLQASPLTFTIFDMMTFSLLALVPALIASVSAIPTSPWSTAVRAVARNEQNWSVHAARDSDTVFSVGCTAFGPGQDPVFVDTASAVTKWFNTTDVGATCSTNAEKSFFCVPPGQPQQTACDFDGALAVWDPELMDCFAFQALQTAVESTCLGGTDCGCGVFNFLGEDVPPCLVATFTLHLSGLAVVNDEDFVGEPVPSNVTVNPAPVKRDTLGPSYNDLTVCAFNNNGDVTRWCEGATTHVC